MSFFFPLLSLFLYNSGLPSDSDCKDPPTMQEAQVRSLSQEATWEKGTKPHSSILAWKIPWTGEPGGLQSMGSQRVRHDYITEHTLLEALLPAWHLNTTCGSHTDSLR